MHKRCSIFDFYFFFLRKLKRFCKPIKSDATMHLPLSFKDMKALLRMAFEQPIFSNRHFSKKSWISLKKKFFTWNQSMKIQNFNACTVWKKRIFMSFGLCIVSQRFQSSVLPTHNLNIFHVKSVSTLHSVEIPGVFCHWDFTWNQFWRI